MIQKRSVAGIVAGLGLLLAPLSAADPPEQSFSAANGLTIKVKMVAPGNEPTPVQILCYLKHKLEGDRVLEALVDFDRKTGGIIGALRARGEFAGEERETLLFVPPNGSLKAQAVLLIGLGDEANLSLATMSRVGTVALREAVRMKAPAVAYASVIKDQGVEKLDAGAVAGAVVGSVVLAYDTEKRLQKQGLAPAFSVREFIYEAGPAFFQATVDRVRSAVTEANGEVARRNSAPYSATP